MLSRVILLLSVGRKRKTDLVAPNQHSRGQTNEYSKEVAAGGEGFFLFSFFSFTNSHSREPGKMQLGNATISRRGT